MFVLCNTMGWDGIELGWLVWLGGRVPFSPFGIMECEFQVIFDTFPRTLAPRTLRP